MDSDQEAPLGSGRDFVLHLDSLQACQVGRLALAWGMTPEEVIAGLVANTLGECAAGVVDLIPGPGGPLLRGH